MWEKVKNIGKKCLPLAVLIALLIPHATAATNETGLSSQETGLLIPLMFFFVLGTAIVFFILPQSKERDAVKWIMGIGIALAAMGILFMAIDLASITTFDFAFWKAWVDATENEIAFTALGAILIIFITAIAVYYEKNQKKERNYIIGGIIAMILWAIFMLYPIL